MGLLKLQAGGGKLLVKDSQLLAPLAFFRVIEATF